jgi:hypothetical protein
MQATDIELASLLSRAGQIGSRIMLSQVFDLLPGTPLE